MPMYLLLIKVNPNQVGDFLKEVKKLPDKPSTGVTLYYTYNVFGPWDCCIWFEADTHENAMNFIQNKIAPITGVREIHTMPTTPIKEYKTQ